MYLDQTMDYFIDLEFRIKTARAIKLWQIQGQKSPLTFPLTRKGQATQSWTPPNQFEYRSAGFANRLWPSGLKSQNHLKRKEQLEQSRGSPHSLLWLYSSKDNPAKPLFLKVGLHYRVPKAATRHLQFQSPMTIYHSPPAPVPQSTEEDNVR